MPARSAARSPSPTSKPSFIDRLKKPFGPKARLFSEFYIQPDDPHRVYGPGDVITGSVVLKVTKPFSVTHIVVCLHGFSQVYKTPNSPGESYRHYHAALASGRTRKAGGYYGNGFMSLFEDEITLCGDGRLGEGTYQFNFELIFPRQHLPSSIDFERGTVSYMITSTLTRPTTLSPTSTCEREIRFQEDIDVAPLSQPKPRIITLEPIAKRTKPKSKVKRGPPADNDHSTAESTVDSEDTATEIDINERATESSSRAGAEPPRSPIRSDVSLDSYMSSSGGTSSAIDSAAPSARTCESRHGGSRSSHGCSQCQKRPITASISIDRAGFLRGDMIPIKVWLTHTRAVKSLRGVIVTLYRQARVDLQPALPLVRAGDEESYPRLRTGISSLSLTAAGATHTYRKDLDQQFASLIVNPATMQAELKVNLRVPEEAFPSIASVPGGMISFKYYVEVVVDIQGKLAGLDKYLPTANAPQGGIGPNRPTEANGGNYAPWGGHFINTEEIKRERSVIYSVFEVVVGTRDSERRSPWKQPETDVSTIIGPEVMQNNGLEAESSVTTAPANGTSRQEDSALRRPLSWDQYWRHHPPDQNGHEDLPPPPSPSTQLTPPPPLHNDEHLSEKERLQRAEARLLPSAPPDTGELFASSSAHTPSAPQLDDERPLPPFPSAPPQVDFDVPASSASHVQDSIHADQAGPSAPAYEAHQSIAALATDDKEELRRQKLQSERSAPPQPEEEADVNLQAEAGATSPPESATPATTSNGPPAPSAPVFADDDDHFGFSAPSHHALPRYER